MAVITTTTTRQGAPRMKIVVALLVGGFVSVALGVYGNIHTPTGQDTFIKSFFGSMVAAKAWLTTVVVILAVLQLLSSLRLYGRINIPRREPLWLADFHRLSGTLALLISLPVAYHCLWALGFNGGFGNTRTLVHSLAGVFLYGAFVAKVSFVRMHGLPRWVLPVAGGLILSALTVIWLTSSWWFFSSSGLAVF